MPISKGLALWISETVFKWQLRPRPSVSCAVAWDSTLWLQGLCTCPSTPGPPQRVALSRAQIPLHPRTIAMLWRSWFPGFRDTSGLKSDVRGMRYKA